VLKPTVHSQEAPWPLAYWLSSVMSMTFVRRLFLTGSNACLRTAWSSVGQRQLCLSEIMTIVIAFHTSPYRDVKAFHTLEVRGH